MGDFLLTFAKGLGAITVALAVGAMGLLALARIMPLIARLVVPLLRSTVRLPTDPVPDSWSGILDTHVPIVARLPPEQRQRLHRVMQLFLEEVPIEGCNGLEVTEAMRVIVAAQASLLVLNTGYPRYPRLRRVLMYPGTFAPRLIGPLGAVDETDAPTPTLGQAWDSGTVILSWDAVRRGAADATDGSNVVLHEFAHVLDAEDGEFDGVPLLDGASALRAWGYALSRRFERHRRLVEAGRRTSLDAYGATNRAEFFAVATEAFFERPRILAGKEPDLYQQLVRFYGLDPGTLGSGNPGSATSDPAR